MAFLSRWRQDENRLEVNTLIFVYLVYIVFIWVHDILCFVINTNGNNITYIVSILIVSAISISSLKKIRLKPPLFHAIDIIFILAIFSICALRIAIPDTSYDTMNYHIYMQERPFANNVSENFFPSSWVCSYSLPLADRMFFPFRRIFGYRLGPSFNALVLVLTFYQCKHLITRLKPTISEPVLSQIAGISILTEQILTQLCIYYVDLLAIPLFLELLIKIQEKFRANKQCLYLCALGGFAVALKLSNLVLVSFFAIIFLAKNLKSIKFKTILCGLVFVIAPTILPYAINTYIQTGNPIFPFYNTIFGSPYLDSIDGINKNFGPKSLIEVLFWPVIVFFEPLRAYDTSVYWGRLSLSYICAILWTCRGFYQIRRKNGNGDILFQNSLLYIICCLIWGPFMSGMIRYALILEVWGGITTLLVIRELYQMKQSLYLCIATILCLMLTVQCSESLHISLFTPQEPGWRNSALVDGAYWKINFEHVFTEYDYNDFLEGVDCIGVIRNNASMGALLSDDIPVVSLNGWYTNRHGEIQFHDILSRYQNIYIVTTQSGMQYTLDAAAEAGITLTEEIRCFPADFISCTDTLCLIKVEGGSAGWTQ